MKEGIRERGKVEIKMKVMVKGLSREGKEVICYAGPCLSLAARERKRNEAALRQGLA